jgi:DNA-binding NarL/FixJ family response regulator
MPTVVIVDDHLMVAEALVAAFEREEGFAVLGLARTGEAGIAMVLELKPDVALVDYRLPDMTGAQVTERLSAKCGTRCVILTGTGQERALIESIDAGAAGFLTKDQPLDDIVAAISGVLRGEARFDSALLARALPGLRQSKNANHRLTDREQEVLRLLVAGMSNGEIGDRLFISTNTVRNHVANVLNKLQAKTRGEAVAIASREGLIGADDFRI